MRETTIKVRMTVDEREAAELRMVELGYENLSQFVRAAIRGSATSSALPAPADLPDRSPLLTGQPAAPCSRARTHRPGVRCGYCGATP